MSLQSLDKSSLPLIDAPKHCRIKGKEHLVQYNGRDVVKFPIRQGPLTPFVNNLKKIAVRPADEQEYLKRLDLHNEVFEDEIKVIGIQSNGRLVISQPLLLGGEPSESEIEDFMKNGGFQRVPFDKQDLPHNLAMTAWYHLGAKLIVVDARPPNFKKVNGQTLLPIDLMIATLDVQMCEILSS